MKLITNLALLVCLHAALCFAVIAPETPSAGEELDRAADVSGHSGGHLTIGDRAIVTAQTGIPNDIEPGTLSSGYPAIDNKTWLKSSALFKRLPELLKRIEALERKAGGTDTSD